MIKKWCLQDTLTQKQMAQLLASGINYELEYEKSYEIVSYRYNSQTYITSVVANIYTTSEQQETLLLLLFGDSIRLIGVTDESYYQFSRCS